MKLLAIVLLLISHVTMGDDLKDYPYPIVCKPKVVVDGVILINKKNWITLEWRDFVSLGKDKLLFKYKGKIVEVPMKGYSCI